MVSVFSFMNTSIGLLLSLFLDGTAIADILNLFQSWISNIFLALSAILNDRLNPFIIESTVFL